MVKVEGERMAVLMFSETKGLALGFFCPDQSKEKEQWLFVPAIGEGMEALAISMAEDHIVSV